MALNILPHNEGPCLRCFLGESLSGTGQSCSTTGVLNMLTVTMASLQSAEAIKILMGSDSIRRELLTIDVWNNSFETIKLGKDSDCPVCVHQRYDHLNKSTGAYTTELCGSDSVQIVPSHPLTVDFGKLADKLNKIGTVRLSPYTLRFLDEKYEIMLFQDGRAIIKNAIDGNNAKSIYTEYIGL